MMKTRIYYKCKDCTFTFHVADDLGKRTRCPRCHKNTAVRIKPE